MPVAVPAIAGAPSTLADAASGSPWWDVDLTSGWVATVLALLAVGATVATAVTWDVERLKRVRRAALMVTAQLLTALTLAEMANLAGGFYGSLSDLAGVRAATPALAPAGSAGSQAPAVEPWLAAARRAAGPGKGVWTPLTLDGARTGYHLPAWVYVPDAYFDPRQPHRRFPVTVLLSGFPGAIENWQRQGRLIPVLDQMMADGRLPPMILVSVSQNPEANRDSECVNAVGGAAADTYLGDDVPEAITAHLRVLPGRSAWSLAGYSTGGFCAVDLALRHPDRYASAVSLDGYFAPAQDATTGDLFAHRADVQRAFTPTATVQDARPYPVRFYLVAGDTEAKSKRDAHAFAALVRAPDSATVVESAGGHNWGTWTAAMPAALKWLANGVRIEEGTGTRAGPPG